MSLLELTRPEIRDLKPYEAAVQVSDTIRLNANEAPFTNPADGFRRPLNRYPEVRPERLRDALAERFGVQPEQLLVTRGSSEAIDLLVRAFCRAGIDNIVITTPTFSMYRHYAEVQGAAVNPVETTAETDFLPSLDALLDACDEHTRLVFLCSPNNPTGTLLPRALIEDFLEARGERSAVVVDEAYIEFADASSVAELIDRFPNLIVLRTLSKALAFAGARCGTVMGPAPVIAVLNAIQAPYALATPVVECVEDALSGDRIDDARARVAEVVAERERLRERLEAFSFVRKIWPSSANFLLVDVDKVDDVMQATGDAGILLRHFGGSLADCLRISVGTAAENHRLVEVLESLEER